VSRPPAAGFRGSQATGHGGSTDDTEHGVIHRFRRFAQITATTGTRGGDQHGTHTGTARPRRRPQDTGCGAGYDVRQCLQRTAEERGTRDNGQGGPCQAGAVAPGTPMSVASATEFPLAGIAATGCVRPLPVSPEPTTASFRATQRIHQKVDTSQGHDKVTSIQLSKNARQKARCVLLSRSTVRRLGSFRSGG
jgi:hypothetical protein